ncbi:hypothetical protein [Falsiroseomonas sp. CW058]|uniref:hypothetical protein n=1 Tax=Falsiroseomonas sp. CW058 TaxID=3388664 RepID=UPI003D31FC13
MHGLIIREPWIRYILDGTKIWEMRTSPTPRRGRIALIRKGTGLVVGTAEIIDSLPPLNATDLAATRDRHRIPTGLDAEVLAAGWVHPWVLHDVRRLPRPVPAGQKPGQVIWVPLDADAVAAIKAQVGEVAALPPPVVEMSRPVRAAAIAPVKTTIASRAEPRPADGPDEVTVVLTDGAIRNGNLSVRTALHLLPESVVGGSNRNSAAARRVTVIFDPGETVETDIDGDKMLLRCRGAVSDFYAKSGAKSGDLVRLQRNRGGVLHVQTCGL